MRFGMFSTQYSPIAFDFGNSSVKILQIGTGDHPSLIAAAQLDIPEEEQQNPEKLPAFFNRELPKLLQQCKFKGKRAVCAVPSGQTFIQHMQLTPMEGMSHDDLVMGQLQTQMGCTPDSVVVRSVNVTNVHRGGQAKTEMICFAIARDTVMRYVDTLRRCRLEAVGAHTEILSMVRAFDHLNRRESDSQITSLYVDLGRSGMRVAISHGREIVFARHIQVGGKHLDERIAATLHCDVTSARAHRLCVQTIDEVTSPGPAKAAPTEGMAVLNAALSEAEADTDARAKAEADDSTKATASVPDRRVGMVPPELNNAVDPSDAPKAIVNVDLSELLDTITDELSMCLRYHQGLFPERKIDRAIFLGGETRQMWLCQHIVKVLRLPGQMGDPLARLERAKDTQTPGLELGVPQPGWAVACGLCLTPTDL